MTVPLTGFARQRKLGSVSAPGGPYARFSRRHLVRVDVPRRRVDDFARPGRWRRRWARHGWARVLSSDRPARVFRQPQYSDPEFSPCGGRTPRISSALSRGTLSQQRLRPLRRLGGRGVLRGSLRAVGRLRVFGLRILLPDDGQPVRRDVDAGRGGPTTAARPDAERRGVRDGAL